MTSDVNRHLDSTVGVLQAAPGIGLAALFGPKHGICGDVLAGAGAFGKAGKKYLLQLGR